ncbi:MAG: YbaY family lipoprotein [Reyranella sp.]|nr:YbaY family lipoprotein [Reyranella sp.]
MRRLYLLLLLLLAMVCVSPAFANEADGISSLAVSRCAGRMGLDVREADGAFGSFALDGIPWTTAEHVEETVGDQAISTTITGTGLFRRRNGAAVWFRYTCFLDAKGQALIIHASPLMLHLGDKLPPSTTISGTAGYRGNSPLPHGIELRLQLLDIGQEPAEVLAEQVVRSGWQQPIAFALRLPAATSLQHRKLVIVARLVLAHRTLFRLVEPYAVPAENIGATVNLILEPLSPSSR